ncbi:IclR family transcriptional regulator [Paraburkholderia caribensis]|uniref:IclR family transcriptional regulator n=1 Tax=Paraburkholderia caribensis TaxID=75105 RepID=UPI001CC3D03B|nr:helix-turn-helix domain-containing protein [Paraburkholderia caribensis]
MSSVAMENSAEAREVRVLARGLAILHVFATSHPGESHNPWLSNQQIADSVGLPRPTVSRLTANLTSAGYLEYSSKTAQYRLSRGALTLGYAAFLARDVFAVARPLLLSLAETIDAAVILATRDEMQMFCHEVHYGPDVSALDLHPGSRLPLPWSAIGRAWLAGLPSATREQVFGEICTNYPSHWASLEPALQDAVSQFESNDFYVAADTPQDGTSWIATPLQLPRVSEKFVLGCARPRSRLSVSEFDLQTRREMLKVKREIERRLEAACS